MYLLVYLVLAFSCMGTGDSFYVAFERSGGFAGMVIATEINSDTLKADDAKNLKSLIDSSGFLNEEEDDDLSSPMADRFVYKITIEANGKKKTVEISEVEVMPQMRPLIDELTRRAKRR